MNTIFFYFNGIKIFKKTFHLEPFPDHPFKRTLTTTDSVWIYMQTSHWISWIGPIYGTFLNSNGFFMSPIIEIECHWLDKYKHWPTTLISDVRPNTNQLKLNWSFNLVTYKHVIYQVPKYWTLPLFLSPCHCLLRPIRYMVMSIVHRRHILRFSANYQKYFFLWIWLQLYAFRDIHKWTSVTRWPTVHLTNKQTA